MRKAHRGHAMASSTRSERLPDPRQPSSPSSIRRTTVRFRSPLCTRWRPLLSRPAPIHLSTASGIARQIIFFTLFIAGRLAARMRPTTQCTKSASRERLRWALSPAFLPTLRLQRLTLMISAFITFCWLVAPASMYKIDVTTSPPSVVATIPLSVAVPNVGDMSYIPVPSAPGTGSFYGLTAGASGGKDHIGWRCF